MLEIAELSVCYGRVEAVRGVSMTVTPGRVTLVLGANGAGKTTTLRSVAGLHPPAGGRVVLEGQEIQTRPVHKVAQAGLVLVPEGRRVFGSLSVEENLQLGAFTAPKSEVAGGLERVYSMFPILRERRNGPAGLLSGGEQQMLAFGRAFISKPKYMLLDEPSMGLAPTMVETVLSSVRVFADEGIGVLMVEQNAEAGLEVADDVVAMTRGEVSFSGSVDTARDNSAVLLAFLGEGALTEHS
ncbi:ATP-binding cassette domain-containing protein [Nakamurella sp. YIM 132087]|uniref:ATP-binding cassette domain-containing protein n=1 Tax=Nakamurella alba TaxID=2665158 RepID=A0A7K1FIY9_9ACTN|nr:ABC transporter ATP-binding protein [Nakamurella alba]MTD13419.1 ATP-binding cassette domain-containing protein [Nakamurella alba]